jgi:predicted double-glycine peptidase
MEKNLQVRYKSQWDDDAKASNNDCGPASIAMILNYYGLNVTTDQVFAKTGADGGLISIAKMQNAIINLGYESEFKKNISVDDLKNYINQDIPVIALVHYGSLNSTQDKNFKGGHFFDVVGYRDDGYFVNDPNFKGSLRQDGDHHFFTKSEFEKAWKDCSLDNNPINSVLIIKRKQSQSAPVSNQNQGQTDLLTKYKVNNLKELDDKIQENLGSTWGAEDKPDSGHLGSARRELTQLKQSIQADYIKKSDYQQWETEIKRENKELNDFFKKTAELLKIDQPITQAKILGAIEGLLTVEDNLIKANTKIDELTNQHSDKVEEIEKSIQRIKEVDVEKILNYLDRLQNSVDNLKTENKVINQVTAAQTVNTPDQSSSIIDSISKIYNKLIYNKLKGKNV